MKLQPGTTRKEWIQYCLSLPDSYEDYPFHDPNWTVMRLKTNKKSFAYLYEFDGLVRINVKCDPDWLLFWRDTYPAVIPGYHMNKRYWNTLILDGTIPEQDIKRMIAESSDLVRKKETSKTGRRAAKP